MTPAHGVSEARRLRIVDYGNNPNNGSVGGIVVSIAAFQAVDPGSIPGQRKDFFVHASFFSFPLNAINALFYS